MNGILRRAQWLLNHRLSLIPCRPNSKLPALPWKQYQTIIANNETYSKWIDRYGSDYNVAIVTGRVSNLVVLDIDSKNYLESLIDENLSVSTPRGYHVYFKHPGNIEVRNRANRETNLDLRGDGGYVIAPPSVVDDKEYKFVGLIDTNDFWSYVKPLPVWVLSLF